MAVLASNPRFINTVLFGNTFTHRLSAIAHAGFNGVEIWQQDAEPAVCETKQQLSNWGLQCTDYQVLLDFDGAKGGDRQHKQHEALRMIEIAAQLGSSMILVAANTGDCDEQAIVADLKWLCQQASRAGLRIAYEAMSWSTSINRCDLAWQIIEQVDEPNLGIVVDAFHLYILGRSLADLSGIPAEKIFLVQLSDSEELTQGTCVKTIARHRRLLPGDGQFPLRELVVYLETLGYQGPIGLEVFNDQAKQQDPEQVALLAKHALEQLLA